MLVVGSGSAVWAKGDGQMRADTSFEEQGRAAGLGLECSRAADAEARGSAASGDGAVGQQGRDGRQGSRASVWAAGRKQGRGSGACTCVGRGLATG